MRFLSLFAGIGGMDLGLERAGWTCVGQIELDAWCRAVLTRHWPEVWRWDDVRTCSAGIVREHCGAIDAIVGGFPCQPHSLAGKRRGQQDERHLWPEFARLVRELRPRWVCAENVLGLRTTAADEVCGDLEAAGYACWPLVVGADDVGAPHRRKRVFIVAHARESGLEGIGPRACGASATLAAVTGGRWPARPDEPQRLWEPPRATQPNMGGGPNGISCRLDRHHRRARFRALGNAVVPQVAEVIGRAIMAVAA